MIDRTLGYAALAVLPFVLNPLAAAAQGAGQRASGSALEEVVVTATRRAEKLQDVAISVSAISAEMLEKQGFQDILQLTQQVPNFSSQSLFGPSGSPFLNIRGISFIDFTDANESSIGLYVDDVYYGAQGAAAGQLFDVERIEVLRGPQGTLFGRNTTGGLVHYISKKPGRDVEAHASVQVGSYGQRIVEGAFSTPITDTLAVRIAAKSNKDDGTQENRVTGTDWGKTDVQAARLTAVLDVTDRLTATLGLNYADSDSTMVGYALFGNRVPTAPYTARCSVPQVLASQCANRDGLRDPNPDPNYIYSEAASLPNTYTSSGGYLNLGWDLGFAQLTSVTGYQEYKRYTHQDIDASDNSIDQLGIYRSNMEQFSQELRLNGETDLLRWVTGLYYYDDNRHRSSIYAINQVPTQNGPADLFTESWAAFAQGDFRLSDTFTLVAGVRYTDETRELENLRNYNQAGASILRDLNGNVIQSYSDDLGTTATTYKLSLEWRPLEDILGYLQYSTGFKSGGFNPSLATSPRTVGPVGEETLDAYELGVKTTLADGRLRLNGAVFYYDFNDYQALAGTSAGGVPVVLFINAGDAKVLGSEVEATWLPIDNLELSLGAGSLDTEFSAPPSVTIDGRPLDGKELPSAPGYNVNGSALYRHAIGEFGELSYQASFKYQDDVWLGPDNNPAETQEAYGTWNFRIAWVSPENRYRLEAFVDNAFDEEYFIQRFESASAFFDSAYGVWGRPRTSGVKLTYTY
jgi:iron complex outermembrane receptor protein